MTPMDGCLGATSLQKDFSPECCELGVRNDSDGDDSCLHSSSAVGADNVGWGVIIWASIT